MDEHSPLSVNEVQNFIERIGGEVSDVQRVGKTTKIVSHYRDVPDVAMPYNVSVSHKPPNRIDFIVE